MGPADGWVTDGGLETDLIYHRGFDLPEFAAFPLLGDDAGRAALTDYFRGYADVAVAVGRPLLLETPTWRANPDWLQSLGYDPDAVSRVNQDAVRFLQRLATAWSAELPDVLIGGVLGPRGDGYVPGEQMEVAEAAAYHLPQLTAFAAAGADRATALTLTDVNEAIGVALAAHEVGLPVAIGFTVETDGQLPGGLGLAQAIDQVDAAADPAYFVVNCAHPDHVRAGLEDGHTWRDRVRGLRVNASRLSHAELDASQTLDDGDIADLAVQVDRLLDELPAVEVLGGCCGTDVRHVAAMWGLGREPSLT